MCVNYSDHNVQSLWDIDKRIVAALVSFTCFMENSQMAAGLFRTLCVTVLLYMDSLPLSVFLFVSVAIHNVTLATGQNLRCHGNWNKPVSSGSSWVTKKTFDRSVG